MVPTTGPLMVTFIADGNACAPGRVHFFVDNGEEGNAPVVQPGQTGPAQFIAYSAGTHEIDVQMDGVQGGCNTGSMSGWSATPLRTREPNDLMLRPRRLRQITDPMTRGRCNVRPTTRVCDGHRGAAGVT
jgi:hypothetical protein